MAEQPATLRAKRRQLGRLGFYFLAFYRDRNPKTRDIVTKKQPGEVWIKRTVRSFTPEVQAKFSR